MNEKNDNSLKRLKSNSSPQPPTLSTPSTTNTSQWKDLPTLEIVLYYLPIKTFKELSLVCKNWNKLTLSHRFESIKTPAKPNEADIWRDKKRQFPESEMNEHILNISQYSRLVTSLTINQILVKNNISLILNTFRNLSKLILKNIIISPVSLDIIASRSERLEYLTLDDAKITESNRSKLSDLDSIVVFETLKYLSFINAESDFESSSNGGYSISHSNVQALKFHRSGDQFLSPFISTYPELKNFDFTNYGDISIRSMATKVLESNPQITHLTYIDNHLTAKICDLMLNHFQNLEYLKIEANKINSTFKFQGDAIKNLRVLDLGDYEEKSAHLALILLPHCSNLTKLKVYIKYEKRKLMDLIATQCPNLTELGLTSAMNKFSKKGFTWSKTHISDAGLWNRTFLCANSLQRITMYNILLTTHYHYELKQFKNLKTAEFEIELEGGIDFIAEELNEYIDMNLTINSYLDYRSQSIKGSILIKDMAHPKFMVPNL